MRRMTTGLQSSRSTSPRSSNTQQRLRVTVKLPEPLIERARDVVAAIDGLTFTALMERCLITCIDDLENKRGSAFPARTKPLRVGRPRRAT